MEEYSIRIRKLRKQQQLTQEELALELGISRSTLGMYETGKREPDFKTLEKIADYFNVDMNYLTGYSDDPHDWEKIGNEEGIYPPKDYEGSYEDFVKFKMMYEESDWYNSRDLDNPSAPLRNDEKQLLNKYGVLNKKGQKEAQKRINELSKLPEYISTSSPDTAILNAAHIRTDITPTKEGLAHDDAIMEDDSEWE